MSSCSAPHSEAAGDVLVDVAARVDHAGNHEPAPRVDRAAPLPLDPGHQLRDDVDTVDALGEINHATAADNQIELRHCVSPSDAGLIGVGIACTTGRTLSANSRRLFSALARGIPP
jgi:hypothetical protein